MSRGRSVAAAVCAAAVALLLAASSGSAHPHGDSGTDEAAGSGRVMHQCIHDELMAGAGALHMGKDDPRELHEVTTEHLHVKSPQSYASEKHVDTDLGDEDTTGGPDGVGKGRRLLGTVGGIRILLDVRRIDPDDEKYGEYFAYEDPFVCRSAADTFLSATEAPANQPRVSCTQADVLTAEKREFLLDVVLEEAKDWFNRALSVEQVEGNLVQATPSNAFCSFYHVICCMDEVIEGNTVTDMPPEHYGAGVADTDFILYVTARPTAGATIAWALTCQEDQNGRPISGMANFGPALISTAPESRADQISTAIHEIGHALGFSSSKFWDFRDPVTKARLGSSNVVSVFTERGHSVQKVITPNVVDAVKAQFDCDDWANAGGELEDLGSAGTAGSHWEKRVFMNEFMTGTASLVSIYSAVSLALFEDTGWYTVDYSLAERLPWGEAEGCTFPTEYCSQWSDRYFCTERHVQGCSPDATKKAVCNLYGYPAAISSYYQYFPSDATLGGGRSYADYCPFYEEFAGASCNDPNNRVYWFYGEEVGANSRCFKGTYILQSASSFGEGTHYGCVRTQCNDRTGILEALLVGYDGVETVSCPLEGGDVYFDNDSEFTGYITCPPSRIVCTGNPCDFNNCDGHGTCVESTGECVCHTGYFGTDEFSCNRVNCPTGDPDAAGPEPSSECSDRGQCEHDIAQLANQPGVCRCDDGFRGSACQDEGCPLRPGVAIPTDPDAVAALECSGSTRGTCLEGGICQCHDGFQGSACHQTECPSDGGGNKCGGTVSIDGQSIVRGTCDDDFGLCTCTQNLILNYANVPEEIDIEGFPDGLEGSGAAFFVGKDCATMAVGEPYQTLRFVGEEQVDESGNVTVVTPTTVHADPEEWVYLSFQVPSVQYATTLSATVLGGGDPTLMFMAACYQQNCIPTKSTNDFLVGNDPNFNAVTKTIVFAPPEQTSVSARRLYEADASEVQHRWAPSNTLYDRVDRMIIGVVTEDPAGLDFQVQLERDPCVTLECGEHGSCESGVDNACRCDNNWSGPNCDVPDCPGVPPCGDFAGDCVVDPVQGPVCQCISGFSGPSCGVVDTSLFEQVAYAAGAVDIDTTLTNTLAIGAERVYFFEVPEDTTGSMYIELEPTEPGADPILLVRAGKVPDLVRDAVTFFDNAAWSAAGQRTQRVNRPVSGGIYFVRVMNGRYATADLTYDLHLQVYATCPPGLRNCNGHGECGQRCTCDPGWEGVDCSTSVPQMCNPAVGGLPCEDVPGRPRYNVGTPVPLGLVQAGEWRYFVLQTVGTTVDLEVSLRQVDVAPRAQPVLVVARVPTRTSTSIRKLTGDSVLFDFDGYTDPLQPDQNLLIRTGQGTSEYIYIGVHNTRNALAPVELELEVTPHASAAFDPTDCNADDTCDAELCHSRGVFTINNGLPLCTCNTGWTASTFCNTPRFTYFGKLQQSAQEVTFLCNLCVFNETMEVNDMLIYKIPQPLQTATGLALDVKGIADLGRASIMVSQYLPRTLFDFVFVTDSASAHEQLNLREVSPTGRYWMVVYAHDAGNYTIEATRDALGGGTVLSESIFKEVSNWMVNDTTGQIVTGMVSFMFAVILCLCFYQICTVGGKETMEQLKGAVTEAANDVAHTHVSDLGGTVKASMRFKPKAHPGGASDAKARADKLNLELMRVAQGAGRGGPPPPAPAPAGYGAPGPAAGYAGAPHPAMAPMAPAGYAPNPAAAQQAAAAQAQQQRLAQMMAMQQQAAMQAQQQAAAAAMYRR